MGLNRRLRKILRQNLKRRIIPRMPTSESALQPQGSPPAPPSPPPHPTSGILFRISSRYRSTRQPATTIRRALPPCTCLCCTISSIVLTDSCFAESMKLQVLTTMISASLGLCRQLRTVVVQQPHHHLGVPPDFSDNPARRTPTLGRMGAIGSDAGGALSSSEGITIHSTKPSARALLRRSVPAHLCAYGAVRPDGSATPPRRPTTVA